MWQAVKQMSGAKSKGPPQQITVNGMVETSPKRIAHSMNTFFIDKVSKIIASIPSSQLFLET